jgi:putative transposase
MKKSRFTESQVISILKEYDGGMKAEDVCRRHGISTATLFNWRKKYAGMEVQQLNPFTVVIALIFSQNNGLRP